MNIYVVIAIIGFMVWYYSEERKHHEKLLANEKRNTQDLIREISRLENKVRETKEEKEKAEKIFNDYINRRVAEDEVARKKRKEKQPV